MQALALPETLHPIEEQGRGEVPGHDILGPGLKSRALELRGNGTQYQGQQVRINLAHQAQAFQKIHALQPGLDNEQA